MTHLSEFDTSSAAERGADLELLGPHGRPILDETTGEPWTIHLLGTDSRKYQEAQHRIANKRIGRRQRTRRGISSEELDSDNLELLIEVTTNFKHIKIEANDPPLTYSRENARLLYTRFPWVREQAEDFIGERSNYLGESLRSSKSSRNGASN